MDGHIESGGPASQPRLQEGEVGTLQAPPPLLVGYRDEGAAPQHVHGHRLEGGVVRGAR